MVDADVEWAHYMFWLMIIMISIATVVTVVRYGYETELENQCIRRLTNISNCDFTEIFLRDCGVDRRLCSEENNYGGGLNE